MNSQEMIMKAQVAIPHSQAVILHPQIVILSLSKGAQLYSSNKAYFALYIFNKKKTFWLHEFHIGYRKAANAVRIVLNSSDYPVTLQLTNV